MGRFAGDSPLDSTDECDTAGGGGERAAAGSGRSTDALSVQTSPRWPGPGLAPPAPSTRTRNAKPGGLPSTVSTMVPAGRRRKCAISTRLPTASVAGRGGGSGESRAARRAAAAGAAGDAGGAGSAAAGRGAAGGSTRSAWGRNERTRSLPSAGVSSSSTLSQWFTVCATTLPAAPVATTATRTPTTNASAGFGLGGAAGLGGARRRGDGTAAGLGGAGLGGARRRGDGAAAGLGGAGLGGAGLGGARRRGDGAAGPRSRSALGRSDRAAEAPSNATLTHAFAVAPTTMPSAPVDARATRAPAAKAAPALGFPWGLPGGRPRRARAGLASESRRPRAGDRAAGAAASELDRRGVGGATSSSSSSGSPSLAPPAPATAAAAASSAIVVVSRGESSSHPRSATSRGMPATDASRRGSSQPRPTQWTARSSDGGTRCQRGASSSLPPPRSPSASASSASISGNSWRLSAWPRMRHAGQSVCLMIPTHPFCPTDASSM